MKSGTIFVAVLLVFAVFSVGLYLRDASITGAAVSRLSSSTSRLSPIYRSIPTYSTGTPRYLGSPISGTAYQTSRFLLSTGLQWCADLDNGNNPFVASALYPYPSTGGLLYDKCVGNVHTEYACEFPSGKIHLYEYQWRCLNGCQSSGACSR